MQGFLDGGATDFAQLQSTMRAIEDACNSIQMHMNLTSAEATILALQQSPRPYSSCFFILENSQLPNARFQAAAVIRNAAIREWGFLSKGDRKGLINFCLLYAMQHASSPDAYVQAKVSAVGAQLMKRGWLELVADERETFFSEIKRAVVGMHGSEAQFTGINFLESLVSEFSLSTSTAMGLPAEFHAQCRDSLELDYLQSFYCWAQDAVLSVSDKILNSGATISEIKACSAALRFMFQIMNWDFKCTTSGVALSKLKRNSFGSGARLNVLRKTECVLVQPGPRWQDILITRGHVGWLLGFYGMLRQKFTSDSSWIDSPLAVSARQLIVRLCSLSGSIFPSDNAETLEKHLAVILSGVIEWVNPPEAVSSSIRCGKSESEMLDGCRALLSMANLTSMQMFDNLLRSMSPFGTLSLLSALTCEVVKAFVAQANEEETWSSDALDILLDTWNSILQPKDMSSGQATDINVNMMSPEGKTMAAAVFTVILESELKAASDSAFDDGDDLEHFHASVSARDERLSSYALIARATADTAIPLLIRLFSERFSLLHQSRGKADPTRVLEELYWLLLIAGHVIADKAEGETPMVPESLLNQFPSVTEAAQHPIVALSCSIIRFCGQCQDPDLRLAYFSPRLMEAVVWFLARWADTYLMPFDAGKGYHSAPGHECEELHVLQNSRKALLSLFGEHNQGKQVLDVIVRIAMTSLLSYSGENDLQAMTCYQLLPALVRRKNVCANLITLDSWHNLLNAFANERILFSLVGPLQRSIAESICHSASGIKNSEAANQYVRDLMGPMAAYIVDVSVKNDLKAVAQLPETIHSVSCLLDRLRGAARATQPRNQKAIFDIGVAVMNPLLNLLEVYKNQSAVVYKLLKFVVDWVDGQIVYLESKDTAALVGFCMQLLQIYSSHNIGKISLSLSNSLLNEEKTEKYKDLRALLQLLTNLCSKDLVDFSSDSEESEKTDISQIVYLGLHILTPLISLELLKYPKLCRDYFVLLCHLLEVYPEKVVQLSPEAFAHVIGTLDFGIRHQDTEVVSNCLSALKALASYHYKERSAGKEGLGMHADGCNDPNGKFQEGILSRFLQSLLNLLLFEDYSNDLVGSAADALLSLILCEQSLYQRLGQELLERQEDPAVKLRLRNALEALTSSNQLSLSLDRINFQKFRKNLENFLIEARGFLRTF
ncbi:hypothetical protein H6P81_011817 [Aristolochia fimbriata]|uniref:Exportin-4 n=1 Tax=Aristolochia fimbriata TaxID=158543 RepID=A0AAV7EBR2_ARIFI|nr:hypothetical protein H6P81_011817 [Aristolochia fimbriata]